MLSNDMLSKYCKKIGVSSATEFNKLEDVLFNNKILDTK